MDQVALTVLDQSKVVLMAFGLGFSRWLAFGSVFALFVWAGVSSGLVRNAIAIGFGLPMSLLLYVDSAADLASMPKTEFIVLMAKEVVLGVLLGLVASVPLWIAEFAGGMLAGLRQEEGGGGKFGGTATAKIFVLIAVGILAYEGGLRLLIGAMYESYASWPVLAPLPQMGLEAGAALLALMTMIFKAAFVLVAPFLLVFVLIDGAIGLSLKLGKQIDLTVYSELCKTLAMLGLILVALFPMRNAIAENMQSFSNLTAILRTLFVASP